MTVNVVHTASSIVQVELCTLLCFLLPGSSILIWKSFFDLKEMFFLPCPGFLNHEYGDFLILMRFISSAIY